MPEPTNNVTARLVVLGVLGIVVLAFGAILFFNIREMGGYDFAFEASKPPASRRVLASGRVELAGGDRSRGRGGSLRPPESKEPAATESAPEWSLQFCDKNGTHDSPPALPPKEVVLLVHGLDDPGWTWNDMIEALVAANFSVARFDYPNDQAIAKSTDMLAQAVEQLKTHGVEHINIVAHSMGGLLARDLLTRPAYYNGDGTGNQTLPEINRLIMIGTPNYGSQLARLRGLSEIGEHLSRAWDGERDLFAFLEDGEGQAGFDLIPASDFLTDLNKRPLAKNIEYTIIAGRLSPLKQGEAGAWVDHLDAIIPRDDLPDWIRERLDRLDRDKVKEALGDLVEGVGDGAVPLDSAVLPEVGDIEIVEADHMTMIVDVLNVGIQPPAIPIVIDRLREDDAPQQIGDETSDEI